MQNAPGRLFILIESITRSNQKGKEEINIMLIISESELCKVANPADINELVKSIVTKQRLEKQVCTQKPRIAEIERVLATDPKAASEANKWDTALMEGDRYGGQEPRKELLEEHQHLTESVAFSEAALVDGRARLGSIIGRISLPFCERERPAFAADIQIAVDSLEEARAAFNRLEARREKLKDTGLATGSLPHCTAPEIVERTEVYFRWIKENYPEIKIP